MEGSVLVIEDEEPVRQLLAVNLQNAGYKVHCAGDIPQAEVLMRQIRPDLVVLSWILPGIPGLPFARRLRSDRRTKDISIVLISTRSEEHDKVAALEKGGIVVAERVPCEVEPSTHSEEYLKTKKEKLGHLFTSR